MSERVVAAVQTGPRAIELTELPRPAVGDGAIVRVEACGICGTDVDQYRGKLEDIVPFPSIPGHEPVGVIDEISPRAAEQWRLKVGDRVAIEPFVPCGRCSYCLTGSYQYCTGWGRLMCYGYIPTELAPSIWGGYATHMYLHPNTVLHKVPDDVAPELAVLFNPLGAGVRWGVDLPRTTVGSSVVVIGPGQRGLATALAAKVGGARLVMVLGLSRHREKLELARALGADVTIDMETEDAVQRVRELTDGRMADVVVEVAGSAVQPLVDAVDLVRPGGTIVLGALKRVPIDGFPADDLVQKGVTVIGARGVTSPGYRAALDIITSREFPLDRLRTHVFGLAEVERAIHVLAGEVPGERAINVVITPGAEAP